MIKNSKFYINNLKTVVFIGYTDNFSELIKLNKSLKINTLIITSASQSKYIDKKIKFKIFNRIDQTFKKYIKKSCNINNTLFVSLGSRIIFKDDEIKNFFKGNLINMHSSNLPFYKGGATFSWWIMSDNRIYTSSAQVITKKIDSGPIICSENHIIPKECKLPIDLMNFANERLILFYKKFIEFIVSGKNYTLSNQPKFMGSYYPRLNTNDNGFINWSLNSYDLHNFINAFDDPYEGASTFISNRKFGKLHIKKVHLHGGDTSNHPYMSGLVIRHDEKWIVVSTSGKHVLLIEEVLNKNNKNIIKKIKVGDRFFTSYRYLEKGKSSRAAYNSLGLIK